MDICLHENKGTDQLRSDHVTAQMFSHDTSHYASYPVDEVSKVIMCMYGIQFTCLSA